MIGLFSTNLALGIIILRQSVIILIYRSARSRAISLFLGLNIKD